MAIASTNQIRTRFLWSLVGIPRPRDRPSANYQWRRTGQPNGAPGGHALPRRTPGWQCSNAPRGPNPWVSILFDGNGGRGTLRRRSGQAARPTGKIRGRARSRVGRDAVLRNPDRAVWTERRLANAEPPGQPDREKSSPAPGVGCAIAHHSGSDSQPWRAIAHPTGTHFHRCVTSGSCEWNTTGPASFSSRLADRWSG